jgi:hypothetical protein
MEIVDFAVADEGCDVDAGACLDGATDHYGACGSCKLLELVQMLVRGAD